MSRGSLDAEAGGDYIVNMAQWNVSLPTDLQRYVDGRVSAGGFASPAAYLRDLIERDQDDVEAHIERVRALVKDGIASGIVEREPEDILDDIIAEIHASDD